MFPRENLETLAIRVLRQGSPNIRGGVKYERFAISKNTLLYTITMAALLTIAVQRLRRIPYAECQKRRSEAVDFHTTRRCRNPAPDPRTSTITGEPHTGMTVN